MLYILILILPLLFYILFAASILFHLKKYAMKGDATPKIAAAFALASLVLIAFTITAYLQIPWDDLDISGELQNLFNTSPTIRIK